MKFKYSIVSALLLIGCSQGSAASERIGLKCSGQVRLPDGTEASPSEEHYVVDPEMRQLIFRDAYTGEAIATYELTVEPRQYRGERQEDGRTNGGFPVHHYESVQISRESGSITSSSLSTTTFPNGPSTIELRFEGHCISEDPDERKKLAF